MHYLVRGSNGKDYGPVDLVTLREWVHQGRIKADTKVRNTTNGMLLMATNMPELDGMFTANSALQATIIAGGYLGNKVNAEAEHAERWEDYKFVILMSILGMFFSLVFAWIAIVFNIIAMKRAYEAAKEQKPLAGLSFSIALLSMIAVLVIPILIGFWMRPILFPDRTPHNTKIGVDSR
jgi:hypothetical protein